MTLPPVLPHWFYSGILEFTCCAASTSNNTYTLQMVDALFQSVHWTASCFKLPLPPLLPPPTLSRLLLLLLLLLLL
jgi:hypothetical protein